MQLIRKDKLISPIDCSWRINGEPDYLFNDDIQS